MQLPLTTPPAWAYDYCYFFYFLAVIQFFAGAYAIAKICSRRQIEFYCYKFVSDSANEHAYRDWAEMISSGQQHYINTLREYQISSDL